MASLIGRNAVVTGSSQGMGREMALGLAREGANVVVNARGATPDSAAAIAAVVDEINAGSGGRAVGCAGAVNDVAFAQSLIETCVQTFGSIDILVNNAGLLGMGAVDRVPLDHWHQVIDTNLNGAFYCIRSAVRHMRSSRHGRIINCASGAAMGTIGGACYAASKGGLISLTYAVAADLGMYGITANAFTPQARSRLSDSADSGFEKAMRSRLIRGYCDEAELRYVLDMKGADAIAPLVTWLALDETDHINGRLFFVEGRRIGLYAEPHEERMLYRDYDADGPWPLERLRAMAATAFPVRNRWPKRDPAEIARILAEIDPVFA